MSGDAFSDLTELFDDDYLHFYGPGFTAERNAREAEVVWRLLGLERSRSVLDLGCGHGRIAQELARRGATVTGLDAAPHFLELARRNAAAAGLEIDYATGDMRALRWRGRFDAVLLWFTTFGYFDDDDNERVVHGAARALKPGGRLLIEQVHRHALLREGLPATQMTQRGDDLMIDHVDYDPRRDRSLTERLIVRDGQVRRIRFAVRLYGAAELIRLLRHAGFASAQAFGRDGAPLTLYDRRLLVVATR